MKECSCRKKDGDKLGGGGGNRTRHAQKAETQKEPRRREKGGGVVEARREGRMTPNDGLDWRGDGFPSFPALPTLKSLFYDQEGGFVNGLLRDWNSWRN